jgi:hypothetical protein
LLNNVEFDTNADDSSNMVFSNMALLSLWEKSEKKDIETLKYVNNAINDGTIAPSNVAKRIMLHE